jgi:glycosyltransferase involved in cell wall biosynthesis
MKPIRLLVDSFADEDALNAQAGNAREIMSRLDPARIEVSTFVAGKPDPRLVQRSATRLVQLGPRGQTIKILIEFIWGRHDILFYIKPSPAARLYLQVRPRWLDKRIVVGMVESQSDLRNEPTVKPEQVGIWERTVLRSDFLFSNSSSVEASLQKEYGLTSEVVPTGVDTKFFTPNLDRAANSRVRVLFVGALRPFKGPGLLLRGASMFPAAEFTIVGDGIMAAELNEQIKADRLSNVKIISSLRAPELREQYRGADIFLFPSRWEGSPKVILEAAACGLPIIARRDYQPETVMDGKTGYLGANDDELLDRLSALIANPQLRREMGRASRLHAKRYDWDLIARRWEEIFVRLAARRRSSGPS